MKRINLTLLFLAMTAVSLIADTTHDLLTPLRKLSSRPSATFSSQTDNIRMFRGDTVSLSFPDIAHLDCFYRIEPDTIWLKKRPKKNPKPGKHYILQPLFRAIENEGKWYTPVDSVENSRFAVIATKEYAVPDGYYLTKKVLSVSLMDIDSGEFLELRIPERSNLMHSMHISSSRVDRIARSLQGKRAYMTGSGSYGYGKSFEPVVISEVEKNITPTAVSYNVYVVDDKGKRQCIEIPGGYSSYSSVNQQIISEAEYTEKYKSYKIDSECDYELLNDSTLRAKLSPEELYTYGWVEDNADVYQNLDGRSYPDAHLSYEMVSILGSLKCRGKEYYKGVARGKAFFVPASQLQMADSMKTRIAKLDGLSSREQDYVKAMLVYLSVNSEIDRIDKNLNDLKAYKKYGIGIVSYSVYGDDFGISTGFKVEFYNPTDQVIKYVNFTLQGYNAVDDRVGSAIQKRCIGPIGPGETAVYDFEYMWWTGIVEWAKFKSLSVIYKNGTTRTVSNPSAAVIDEDIIDRLNTSSPLEYLK